VTIQCRHCYCRRVNVGKRMARVRNTGQEIPKVDNHFRSLVCRATFSLIGAEESGSCHLLSQPSLPPFLKMMSPFMLQHLKSERGAPSAIELPSCEPQHGSP
jgi:hypothetical protein